MSKLFSKTIDNRMYFAKPLKEARIIARPNRFIVLVDIDGQEVRCHCPSTGSIGGLTLDGLLCLVSGPYDSTKRSTQYTLEAFAVEEKTSSKFQWIGVNQTSVNAYVEEAIGKNMLSAHKNLNAMESIRREVKLGNRRIDFLVDDKTFIEVKMPLKQLQVATAAHIPRKAPTPTMVERMTAQVDELTGAIKKGQQALMFIVFIYDNPGFKVLQTHQAKYSKVRTAIKKAEKEGMESWQINFAITPDYVELQKFYKLPPR